MARRGYAYVCRCAPAIHLENAVALAGQAGVEIAVDGIPGPNSVREIIDEHRKPRED